MGAASLKLPENILGDHDQVTEQEKRARAKAYMIKIKGDGDIKKGHDGQDIGEDEEKEQAIS